MISRLPNLSRTGHQPMWQAEGGPHALRERYPHPSIHQGDFSRHNLPPIPSFKSKVSAYISRLPMSSEVRPHEIVHEPFDSPRRRNVTRKGEMEKIFLAGSMGDACSNYRLDFTRKQAERSSNFKPIEERLVSEQPFSEVSVYRKEFPTHDLTASKNICSAGASNQHRRERRSRLNTSYTAPNLPFHADTTYGLAFRASSDDNHGVSRHAGLPTGDQVVIAQSDVPFESRSVYRAEYVPKPTEAPQVLQNLSALSYNCDKRPPSRVQKFVEHADHMFYQP